MSFFQSEVLFVDRESFTMPILIGIAVVGTVYVLYKKAQSKKKAITRAGMLSNTSEIVACLVNQVYALDRGKSEQACAELEALGYEEHDLSVDQPVEHIEKNGSPCCKVRFMVFRRRDTVNISGSEQEYKAVRPKYVVAIRGTRPRCQQDITNDLGHWVEKLHTSDDFSTISKMTKKTVQKYGSPQVCVAGHSLGAAFGLLVARELVLEGEHVETHLFNPPFLTMESLLSKVWGFVGDLSSQFPSMVQESVEAIGGILKEGVDLFLDSDRDKALKREMDDQFNRLHDWIPNLYLNENDIVCNEYLTYFEKAERAERQGRGASSISRSARALNKIHVDAKSFHMIPSAVLHFNDTQYLAKKVGSHHLKQWYQYPASSRLKKKYQLRLLHDDDAE